MAKDALPCIVCGKPLRNVMDDCDNQPYVGTAFTTGGHYGSTVWDEGFTSQEQLEINVCDTCLLRAGDSNRVLRSREERQKVVWHSVLWAPDPDRHHTLKENEREYGSAWGADEPYVPAYEDVEADPFHAPEELEAARQRKEGAP